MSTLDDDFNNLLVTIGDEKVNFTPDEQNIVDAWVAKLSEPTYANTDDLKTLRNQYASTLAQNLQDKALASPFDANPPTDQLTALTPSNVATFNIRPLPCSPKMKGTTCLKNTGAIPKTKIIPKKYETLKNAFESQEEMAKILARSKGMTFPEFVVSISRHTVDFGRELKKSMLSETTTFKEYVDHVLSQRLKDLTLVLDEEQNEELQRIKIDLDKWQLELSNCKKRIREIIPQFDLESYKREKNYLSQFFSLGSLSTPSNDETYKMWKEESCYRLKWYSSMIHELTESNNCINQELDDLKGNMSDLEASAATRRQAHCQFVKNQMCEYQKLKQERDRIAKENADLLNQLEDLGDD